MDISTIPLPADHPTVVKARQALERAESNAEAARADLARKRIVQADIEAAAAAAAVDGRPGLKPSEIAAARDAVAAAESTGRIAEQALDLAAERYSDALDDAEDLYLAEVRSAAEGEYRALVKDFMALADRADRINAMRSAALGTPAAAILAAAPAIVARYSRDAMAPMIQAIEAWLSPVEPVTAPPPGVALVKFTKRPIWAFFTPFGKNYAAGDVVGLSEDEATKFIEAGVAEAVDHG